MTDRVPLPTISGLLSEFVNVDLFAGHFAAASRLVGFQPAVTDAPSGGSVSVDIRTATAGGGSGLSATIADGTRFPATPATGVIEVAAGTDLYLRITAATGAPLGLYGHFIVESAAGAVSALTTLVIVKEYLGITDGDSDTLLTRIIGSVSKKMQQAMRRSIVAQTVTAEKKSISGHRQDRLLLDVYPVTTGTTSVTLSDTALTSSDFAVDLDTGIVHYTPGGVFGYWPAGHRHVSVTYDGGYAAVPADIEGAATIQSAWEFKRQKRLGDRTSVIGDNTATFLVDAWAPDVVPVIESYRARRV